MFNLFKKSRAESNYQIVNIIILIFFLVVLFPVVPISFFIIAICYMFKEKGMFWGLIITPIIILIALLTIALFQDNQISVYQTFQSEFHKVLKSNVSYMFKGNIIMMLKIYFNYSFSSWLIIILFSFVPSSYFLYRMNKYRKLEKAGVTTFKNKVKKINTEPKPNNNQVVKPKQNPSTLIGYNQNKKAVYCDDNAKHIFIAGTTGSGKTVLLSNFIKSGISKNYGMFIIDGKGDIGEGSMLDITEKFCAEYNKKLIIINMTNPEKSDKYNPFGGASDTMCKDMLINMTDWSEEHYKSNAERYIQRLIKLLNLKCEKLSFEKIIEHLSREKFETLSSDITKLGLQTKEEHITNLELIKASGKITENAGARFATISESEVGTIFDENGVDIYTALKSGAVILFVLNPLKYPETSIAMGRLILIDAKQAISKMFSNTKRRSFFIFDEINVYASTVLIDLINKSRSAKVTCIPATQSLADLEAIAGESFKQQIIENCNNYVVLRQNSFASAEEWAKTLGTKETMQMTYQVSKEDSTGMGTAKKVREFIVHPDEIKAQQTGAGIFLSRDNGKCERINIIKPF
jgi:type IV secretory pathway TraG/TraD family ATPase VirD4